ncbi:MAG: hypothetical protein EOO13_16765 [Chitinophagaceae bacterium]|nr:MAG: hypothetical protein EOO13_16765 [Chitinophagaceae bacterium]
MKQFFLLAFTGCFSICSIGQNVGIGTNNPDPSAALDITSTRGLLIPRMTEATRILIPNPAFGLLIYQTDGITGFYYHSSSGWVPVLTPTLQQNLNTNGKYISNGDHDNDEGLLPLPGGGLLSHGHYFLNSSNERSFSGYDGAKFLWWPSKAAFRLGNGNYQVWETHRFGKMSFGVGQDPMARGFCSVSIGDGNVAYGDRSIALGAFNYAYGENSTAMGSNTIASGYTSTVIGWRTRAAGWFSTALGRETTASGDTSTAMGYKTTASGNTATAMGWQTTASGNYSTSMGVNTTASGHRSTAIGTHVSTNGQSGAFIIGDASTTTIQNALAEHSFTSRFAGGYRLFTNAGTSVGVQLGAGGNAWTTISDVHRKENFAPIDGENFLQRIRGMNLVSWNYKGQDPKTFRHYGPMAQEFYAAFGKDNYGTIGNDTTINQADFDGVNLIAIQALEKRTADLQNENNALKERLEKLEKLIANK